MITLGQISQPANPATQVGIWAVAGLCCYGIWVLLRRLLTGPTSPDPWDETVAAEIEKDGVMPLCHRCLTPHDSSANFCPACGAAVGQYTNWLPYPYVFSVGHTLRIGTSGEFKRSPLTIIGFFVFSLLEYTLFAPIYWVMFLLTLRKSRPQPAGHDSPAPVS